jgi:3-dehydroquinate synthetase
MAKTLLSLQDLQARALAEIRKQPGCSNVRNIAINRVTDERAENNWSMCVLSAGAADANTAARAALNVQHALRHDYESNGGLTAGHGCGVEGLAVAFSRSADPASGD